LGKDIFSPYKGTFFELLYVQVTVAFFLNYNF